MGCNGLRTAFHSGFLFSVYLSLLWKINRNYVSNLLVTLDGLPLVNSFNMFISSVYNVSILEETS